MTFEKLALVWQQLEQTNSRLEITQILADLLKKASEEDVGNVCYLSLGNLASEYQEIDFNLAEKMMMKVIAQASGQPVEIVRKKFKQVGDLGEVAESFAKQTNRFDLFKKSELTVNQVHDRLLDVATQEGEGSVERKVGKMVALLEDLSSPQAVRYAVRIPIGKLRLGFSSLTILDALSWMLTGDKSKREEIEAAYNVKADVGEIAKLAKRGGLKTIQKARMSLGVPIKPALCQRIDTAKEIVEKMGQVAVEPKYDGQRLQIHWGLEGKDKVRIFTRNLEGVTSMFPDLVQALGKELKAKKAILDGEVIGYDRKKGKYLPFQETIKRKRKYGITQAIKDIPLQLVCFDLLYLNGKDLIQTDFDKRRKELEKILPKENKTIVVSPQILTDEPGKLISYHYQQINQGLEGIVVKKWRAPYDPGKRNFTWVKLKQEKGKKGGGLADTLDCLIMGYYRGKGRRAGFGIGGFLAGVRVKDKYLTLSKIGTGLTDKQWRELKKRADQQKTTKKPKQYQVSKDLAPDVWCQPAIMAEIEADNITKSPLHSAKLALRFPRLKSFRDDKNPNQTTTIEEVKKLYELQK